MFTSLIVSLAIVSLSGTVKVDGVKANVNTPVTLESNIEVGLNSKLILDNGLTITAMKKGLIKDFLQNKNKKSEVAGTVAKDTTGSSKTVSTSSSRASEAKDDLEWEE